MALCQGLPGWGGTRKVKPTLILLKQETVSGSGISGASFLQAGCPSCCPTNSIKALKANQTYIHTHPFNGPFSRTTWISWYQKGKTNLDFTEARDSEWQWQVCTSLQTDNHASTSPLRQIKNKN